MFGNKWDTYAKRKPRSLIDILQSNASEAQAQYIHARAYAEEKDGELFCPFGADPKKGKLVKRETIRSFNQGYQRKAGYVYLLYFGIGNLYKLGLTVNIIHRMRAFKDVLSPFDLSVEHLIETDDMAVIENSLHEFFIKKRFRGEWFTLDHDDIELIKSLKGIMIYKEVYDVSAEKIPA